MAACKCIKLFANRPMSVHNRSSLGGCKALHAIVRRFSLSIATANVKTKEVEYRLGHKPVLVAEVLDVIEPSTNQVISGVVRCIL